MKPEDRAKTICTILEADTSARLEGDDWATLERLIVEEIRDAEDAALERAAAEVLTARRAMSCFVNTDDCQQFNLGVVAAETAVLNLKSKEI